MALLVVVGVVGCSDEEPPTCFSDSPVEEWLSEDGGTGGAIDAGDAGLPSCPGSPYVTPPGNSRAGDKAFCRNACNDPNYDVISCTVRPACQSLTGPGRTVECQYPRRAVTCGETHW